MESWVQDDRMSYWWISTSVSIIPEESRDKREQRRVNALLDLVMHELMLGKEEIEGAREVTAEIFKVRTDGADDDSEE